jgi:PAS domain S-box-containing protein
MGLSCPSNEPKYIYRCNSSAHNMQEEQDTPTRILRALRFRPKGMTITEIARHIGATRNSVSKHLEIQLVSGRVEVQTIGNAKLYTLAHRVPLSAFLCFTKNIILVLDSNHRIVQVNDRCLQQFRRTKDELLGLNIREAALPVVSTPETLAIIEGLEREQVTADARYRQNGEEFFYYMQVIPTTFEDGEKGCTIVLEEITGRKRAEEELRESEQRFRSILDNSLDALYRRNLLTGRYEYFSPAVEPITGFSVNEMAAMGEAGILACVHPDDLPTVLSDKMEFSQQVASGTVDYRFLCKDGTYKWLSDKFHINYDAEGRPLVREGIVRDITERKRYIQEIEFLARTSRDFRDMGEDDDIYEYVAREIFALAPGFLVWVGIQDETNKMLVLKSVVGDPVAIETSERLLGTRMVGMRFPLQDTAGLAHHKKLVKTPPFPILMHKRVPEETCRQLEEASGGIDNYLMGLVSKGRFIGSIGIGLPSGTELPNRELIEAFIRQAAIAIEKKVADDNLRQSLVCERERAGNLLFLSRTAMDFIEMGDSADIHRYIGDRIHELIPESMVGVFSFNADRHETVFRAISGDEAQIERLWEILGINLLGMSFPINPIPRTDVDLSMNRLFERPSFYPVTLHQIPEERWVQAVNVLNLGKLYGMVFSCKTGIQGSIQIALTRPGDITNAEVIEAFVNQASVALMRRSSRERLRKSEGRFRDVVEFSPFPAAIIDADGAYAFVNRQFTETFGYALEDIPTGREWFVKAFPDETYRREAIAAWQEDWGRAKQGQSRPRTFSVRCKDGEEKVILFRPVELCDGTQYVIYEDVTEDRRAYEVLISEIAELRRK